MPTQEEVASNLPKLCPKCNADMEFGFVHAGEDVVQWSTVNRNKTNEDFTKDVLFLQRTPKQKSFRLSSEEAEPLQAHRCAECKVVILAYEEAIDWNELKRK